MGRHLIAIPALGPGELVTVTDDPDAYPEKGEILWTEAEIDVLRARLNGAPDHLRDNWIRYIDAVKRMYVGAKLMSLEPLRVDHPELTQEALERIPWEMLPRR